MVKFPLATMSLKCTVCNCSLVGADSNSNACSHLVSEKEICTYFDLSQQDWNFYLQSTNEFNYKRNRDCNNDSVKGCEHEAPETEGEMSICVCPKCEMRIKETTSLHEELIRIQLQLSALKSSLLMEILNFPTSSFSAMTTAMNPFQQFIKRRYSPKLNLSDYKLLRKTKHKRTKLDQNRKSAPKTTIRHKVQKGGHDSLIQNYCNSSKSLHLTIKKEKEDLEKEIPFVIPPEVMNEVKKDHYANTNENNEDEEINYDIHTPESREFVPSDDNSNDYTNDIMSESDEEEPKQKKKKKTSTKTTKAKSKSSTIKRKPKTKEEKRIARCIRRRRLYALKNQAAREARENKKELIGKGELGKDVEEVEGRPGVRRYKQQWEYLKESDYLFRCRVGECDQAVYAWQSLKYHFNVHHNSEMFRCNKCRRAFKTEEGHTNHLCKPKIIKGKIRTRVLPNGRIIFDNKFEYEKVEEGDFSGFRCCTCLVTRRTKHSMDKHIKERHIDPTQFVCHVCSSTFGSKKHFNQHMELHSEDVHICDECGQLCKTKITLYLHKQTHNNWICETCGLNFKYKSALNSHVKKVHHPQPQHQTQVQLQLPQQHEQHQQYHPPFDLHQLLNPEPQINYPSHNTRVVSVSAVSDAGSKILSRTLEPATLCPNCLRFFVNIQDHMIKCNDPDILKCKEPECSHRFPFKTYFAIRAHKYRHKQIKEDKERKEREATQLQNQSHN